ncbi:MAG: glycosyltransferase family 2 protein [Candidatus Shapirobacteria bacterium]|nr:glycosyltransferase family 2 protein [Candidatus Shapirobacteria bacterium]MDD4410532.1 glycosyltransferase family 2 protein [Candidatus Shapirobacteria bacterium]
MNSLVSIIIVNYNGYSLLKNCLNSILKNSYKNYEIIIADNGSTDGTIEKIKFEFKSNLSKIKILDLKKNFGPAFARNRGVKIAKGKIISFLDNDTEVDINWLKAAKSEFDKDKKIGCIQSKLLLLNEKNKFDYTGDYLNQFGLLSHRATYKDIDVGQYDKKAVVFAAKSAGMFIRKDVFKLISGFDNDYFIYMEETDLCWRSWLKGFKTVYCPNSIVYHGFSGSFKLLNFNFANYNLYFHGTKNYILTILKNLSLPKLIIILPKQISIFILYSIYLLFIKFKVKGSFYIILGIIWNIKNIKKTLLKRRTIQKNRVLTDKKLFTYIYKKESIINKINKSILLKV